MVTPTSVLIIRNFYIILVGLSAGGIYLPVLRDPATCMKRPIVILYTSPDDVQVPEKGNQSSEIYDNHIYEDVKSFVGHFTAVVGLENMPFNIPLCYQDYSPLRLRYCLRSGWLKASSEERQQKMNKLLHSYIDVENIRLPDTKFHSSTSISRCAISKSNPARASTSIVYKRQVKFLTDMATSMQMKEIELKKQLAKIQVSINVTHLSLTCS
jgi:hypothetical protein